MSQKDKKKGEHFWVSEGQTYRQLGNRIAHYAESLWEDGLRNEKY